MSHWRDRKHLSRPRVGAMQEVRRRWRVNWPALVCALLAVAIMVTIIATRAHG